MSKEDELTHLTSLNSMRVFKNCDAPIMINGSTDAVVAEQIQNALKEKIERLGRKNNKRENAESESARTIYSQVLVEDSQQGKSNNSAIMFNGRALTQILRDETLQKSFITLAYMTDMVIGSDISPLQKQKLVRMTKDFVGHTQNVMAILATTEDQFMANEADLVCNFESQNKSIDFEAVSDVSF